MLRGAESGRISRFATQVGEWIMGKNVTKAQKNNSVAAAPAELDAAPAELDAAPVVKGKKDKAAPAPVAKASKGKKGKGKPAAAPKEHAVKARKVNGVEIATKLNAATDGKMAGCFARVTIFGHPLSRVLRAAAKAGMAPSEMRAACDALGLEAVKMNTIRDKMSTRDQAKEMAPLSKADIAKLHKLAEAGASK